MKKILVANRGEIALRIMRSLREMEISTVAVFSEADRHSPHVRFADEAVCLGPAPSSESYLLQDKIIDFSKKLGVDAIHPGYGFLSENAGFAEKVEKAGLIFIGPSPKSMEIMGSKLGAKAAAKANRVPMVPGTDVAISNIAEAKKIAEKITFPLLIKASAGGGGKGMRKVEKSEDFEEEVSRAMSEAQKAFGDNSVFIEKYVASPRHIEIQVLGDKHGNLVYLFERECSIQRRHQKLVEEAPSCLLTPDLRKEMGECAVRVAKAAGYYNAGTVEFLVDEKLNYYFLEMNTRLQVEHPVTEFITGLDLVKEQVKIAAGEKLSFTQNDLTINGHSIEIRVCAEDPLNNFLPDTGKLIAYKTPAGPGIRVDDGLEEGMEVQVFYDPMIAKLIVHAPDRTAAIRKMISAIRDYQILGVETTLGFCRFVMEHPAFVSGKFDTHFVANHFNPSLLSSHQPDEELAAAMLAGWLNEMPKSNAMVNHEFQLDLPGAWKKNRLA